MYGKQTLQNKGAEDPNEPRGTIAVVVRMALKDMPAFTRSVEEIPGARLIYQRTSAGRLRIVPESDDR
jgi:hypothetical protein